MNQSQPRKTGIRTFARVGMIPLVVGLLAVVGLLIPLPFWGRVAVAVGDLVHAPLFAGLTLGTLCLLQRLRPTTSVSSLWSRCVVVVVSLFSFGVAMEGLQSLLGRSAAVHDAMANGLGTLAAAFLFCGWQLPRQQPEIRWRPRVWMVIAASLIAIASWTPLVVLYDVAAVYRDFPLLASFESSTELQRWHFRECKPHLTREDATEGSYSMALTYQPTDYPAATLIELQSDWSKIETLELDVTLDKSFAQPSVPFIVKVIDALHQSDESDVFRGQWTLARGQRQHIRITREEIVNGPSTHPLDLSKIQYVNLIVPNPKETAQLRIDAVRLTLQ